MKFKLPCRRAKDVHAVLTSVENVNKLTRSRSGFRAKLESLLLEKGGEGKLFNDLCVLADFAVGLKDAPVDVEVEVKAEGRP